ncbi:TPA: glycosyltransferase [Bacillus cereus]|uniref:glycosyltransferase family 2 protein n=1 Tax=Bacillus TaxID=1386 RepID=UPI0007ABE0A0|nr:MULTISPECIES: glycosyltransferase [Bacillus]KZD75478.1 Beta-13-glucosyltransferase [Bacillus cereus]MCI2250397.1 glycosyltransferase [Bacillus cereus]MCQ6290501.1 glycosyltransferase [Bacillus cereus]MCT1381752.1 glycosyltransferase [Bacillus sp. p3-SID196]BCC61857.1 beta-1,3-N-acetylglucosaminyltransferase [Bacillus cereus]
MLNKNQLVSVIVPLYNTERYIEQTIQSILNQTYTNVEIIIIDDDSTDNSASIVKEITNIHPNKIHYIHQQNQGVSVARNTGIENAAGEYIAFLDSDDLWHPTKLEKQIQSMHANKMNACYCGHSYFYELTQSKTAIATKFIKGDIASAYLGHQVIAQTSTWIFKKSLLIDNNIRFTPGCSWGEDLEFLFKLTSITNVCYVEEYLTDYRILNEGNLSSKYSDYKLKTTIELEVYQRIKIWIQENTSNLITSNHNQLNHILDTYLIPFTIIHSAYTYMLAPNPAQETINQINTDLKKYCHRISLLNKMNSIKLLVKLCILRFKLFSSK